jgi:hypothetical protein
MSGTRVGGAGYAKTSNRSPRASSAGAGATETSEMSTAARARVGARDASAHHAMSARTTRRIATPSDVAV